MKTLAVDDDPHIRELLPIILEKAGITDVTVVRSAEIAIDTIVSRSEPFECFLLDIRMPGGDGIELCRAIRRLPAHRDTPIIMLTAMHEKSFVDEAFAAGATDYTTKPFDINEICARIGMAKLLVEEQRHVRKLLATRGRFKKAPEAAARFSKRLDLRGVNGLVSACTFENYLRQLSRRKISPSTFFAIHVENGRSIFDRCTLRKFKEAMCHVADAAIAARRSGSVISCYVGSGNFICSPSAESIDYAAEIEAEIQDIVDGKDLLYDDGSPLDIEIAIHAWSEPLDNMPLRLASLEAQAVKHAVARAQEKKAKPAAPKDRPEGRDDQPKPTASALKADPP